MSSVILAIFQVPVVMCVWWTVQKNISVIVESSLSSDIFKLRGSHCGWRVMLWESHKKEV